VDLSYQLPHLVSFHKLRIGALVEDPGGGGINVARVLKALGTKATALTLLGGPTGEMMAKLLDLSGVDWRCVRIAGDTRLSINLHTTGEPGEFRLVPDGPNVTAAEWGALLALVDQTDAAWVVASSSLPPGLPDDAYATLARRCHAAGRKIAIDTSDRALPSLRGRGIDLLKLSQSELRVLAPGFASDELAARSLIADGTALRLAVTLGEQGAWLADSAGFSHVPAIPVEVKSTVGAGDAFLAGLVDALARGKTDQEALKWANATAAAAVAHEGTAHVTLEAVKALAG
jgi:6-phosphofructokinase 2